MRCNHFVILNFNKTYLGTWAVGTKVQTSQTRSIVILILIVICTALIGSIRPN